MTVNTHLSSHIHILGHGSLVLSSVIMMSMMYMYVLQPHTGPSVCSAMISCCYFIVIVPVNCSFINLVINNVYWKPVEIIIFTTENLMRNVKFPIALL